MPTLTRYTTTIGPTQYDATASDFGGVFYALVTVAFQDETGQPIDAPWNFKLFVPPTPGLSVGGRAIGTGAAITAGGTASTTFAVATAAPAAFAVKLTNNANLTDSTFHWRPMPYAVTTQSGITIEQNDVNGVPIVGQAAAGSISWTIGSPPAGVTFTVRPLTSGLMIDGVAAAKTYTLANGTATFTLTVGTPGFYRFDVLNSAGLPELAVPLGVKFDHPRDIGRTMVGTPAGSTTAVAN